MHNIEKIRESIIDSYILFDFVVGGLRKRNGTCLFPATPSDYLTQEMQWDTHTRQTFADYSPGGDQEYRYRLSWFPALRTHICNRISINDIAPPSENLLGVFASIISEDADQAGDFDFEVEDYSIVALTGEDSVGKGTANEEIRLEDVFTFRKSSRTA